MLFFSMQCILYYTIVYYSPLILEKILDLFGFKDRFFGKAQFWPRLKRGKLLYKGELVAEVLVTLLVVRVHKKGYISMITLLQMHLQLHLQNKTGTFILNQSRQNLNLL